MSTTDPTPIALVLDQEFGERLVPLATRAYVWIVRSPANDAVVDRLRAEGRHLTTFNGGNPHANREVEAGTVEEIDLHHGKYSCEPPYRTLEVYGSSLTEEFHRNLTNLGFATFYPIAAGFVATKGAHD